MRKIISWVVLGLGAFLVVAAVMALVWAPGQVKRTPLATNSTTDLSGTATVLPAGEGDYDVKATSITRADSEASDDEVIVFENHSCLVLDEPGVPVCGEQGTGEDADPRVVSISSDFFATDRVTAEAVDAEGYIPEETADHEGLINKFPFDVEQKDYEFWDGLLKRAVTASYEGTEEVKGLETYRFNYTVDDEPAEVAPEIDGTYSMDKTMWIDPVTGAIIAQEQHDVRAIDGAPVLDLRLAFTDEQVQENVDSAEESISSIKLLTSTVPLVGFILGPILLIAGGLMLALGRRGARRSD